MTRLDTHSDSLLFFVLFGGFAVFYLIQIPFTTSNADVLVYALRAMSDKPILDFAFLDERLSTENFHIFNYHLAHTLLLWCVYHIAPAPLADTIWPAGATSAVFGALAVGLTFKIWRHFEITKLAALCTAIVVGIIPSIWYHSLIGEVYVAQLALTLLFLHAFLRQQFVLSSVAFLLSVLFSPISGLSFGLILLAPWSIRTVTNAVLVGGSAFVCYLMIFFALDAHVFSIFEMPSLKRPGKPFAFNAVKFMSIVLLNINFLMFFLLKGLPESLKQQRKVTTVLAIGVMPYVVLAFLPSNFMRDLGSFLLIPFWALCLPIGLAIASATKHRLTTYAPIAGNLVVAVFVWFVPNQQIATARHDAGEWLATNVPGETKLIGTWNDGIGITLARYGWELPTLSQQLIYRHRPGVVDFNESREPSLIVLEPGTRTLRTLMSYLPFDNSTSQDIPFVDAEPGSLRLIYQNASLTTYEWSRHVQDDRQISRKTP